ncbi:hypothetical protein IFR05_002993 [Cadophora sp. M221]|nr:hypothetical protein IFR05_002993 [Cadophora sp. M221]
MDHSNRPNCSANPQRTQYPVLASDATGSDDLQNGNNPSRARFGGVRRLTQLELGSDNSGKEGEDVCHFEELEKFRPGALSNGNAASSSDSPGPVRRTGPARGAELHPMYPEYGVDYEDEENDSEDREIFYQDEESDSDA